MQERRRQALRRLFWLPMPGCSWLGLLENDALPLSVRVIPDARKTCAISAIDFRFICLTNAPFAIHSN